MRRLSTYLAIVTNISLGHLVKLLVGWLHRMAVASRMDPVDSGDGDDGSDGGEEETGIIHTPAAPSLMNKSGCFELKS